MELGDDAFKFKKGQTQFYHVKVEVFFARKEIIQIENIKKKQFNMPFKNPFTLKASK